VTPTPDGPKRRYIGRRPSGARGLAAAAVVAAALITLAGTASPVAQWPDFRGPDGQGHADGAAVPLEWSETRNVVWKVPVPGTGWSSPVIADGRVWMTTAITRPRGGTSLRALAFDATSGAELVNVEVFTTPAARAPNPKNSLASPTPVLADGHVYVHFGADGTAALSSTGDIIWKTRLPYDSQHGSGGSPVIAGDRLILIGDGFDEAFIVALDRATGKRVWRTDRRAPFTQAYATPLVVRVGSADQVIAPGAYRTEAYDAATGRAIWRVSYGDGFSNVARPVVGHGLAFISSGYGDTTLLAVRLDGTGDVTRTHVAWRTSRAAPYTSSPLLVGDQLYFVSDIGVATSVDARTGVVRWQQRLGGNYSASPIDAGGRIYFQNEEGVTTVVAPGPDFRRLAVSQLDGTTFASLAVAGDALFLRSDRHLYKIGDAQ
jgi:outer membrane protein assembly factor BamB